MSKSRLISKFIKLTVLFLAVAALAQANLFNFAGIYAPGNWTLSNPVGGSVNTSGAPASVLITGGDSGSGGYTTWTITAPAAGSVSFDWSYLTSDWEGPFWDPAGYVVNGSLTQLSSDVGSSSQTGSAGFSVSLGDTFGFYVRTVNGSFGAATITPSNFSAPGGEGIPEPATWLLVSVPLLLAGLRRRWA